MKICHRNHGPGRGCLQEAEKQRDRGPVRHLAKLLVMAMGRDSKKSLINVFFLYPKCLFVTFRGPL